MNPVSYCNRRGCPEKVWAPGFCSKYCASVAEYFEDVAPREERVC